MSTSKRSAILQDIQTAIVAVDGLHAERVKIGFWREEQINAVNVVQIQPGNDRMIQRLDGNEQRRELVVVVAAFVRIDPVSSTQQTLQLDEFFAPVHAALETLAEGNVNGKVEEMYELGDGVIVAGVDDKDSIAWQACAWRIGYRRALGQP